jgi:hypothetical protein
MPTLQEQLVEARRVAVDCVSAELAKPHHRTNYTEAAVASSIIYLADALMFCFAPQKIEILQNEGLVPRVDS